MRANSYQAAKEMERRLLQTISFALNEERRLIRDEIEKSYDAKDVAAFIQSRITDEKKNEA